MFSSDLGINQVASTPAATDPPFQKVALLLHGDGTNGAQNNTFVDGSTNNFTVTRTGNVAQGTFSPFSLADGQWSNYFDGTGDYLTVPSAAALQLPTQDFTIECWAYFSALPTSLNTAAIFNKGRTSASDFEYQLVAYNNNLNNTIVRASYGTNGSDLTVAVDSGTNYISANTWYHIALTRTGTTAKLWLNGVNVGTTTSWTSTQYSGSGALGIGANNAGSGTITGYISNARIVKGTAVYTTNFTPPTSALTAITNTSLLTCQSNRFVDNSANNFTITSNGDTNVTAFSPFAPSAAYSASTNGGSGYFDGSGDYLTASNNSAWKFGTGDFTIELWYYPSGDMTQYDVLVKCSENSTWNNGWTLNIGSGTGNTRAIEFYPTNQSSTPPIVRNQWNHIAVTRSGTTLSYYCNGVRGSTATVTTDYQPTNVLSVGADAQPSYDSIGYITDVRILKGTALYTGATYTVPTSPLSSITNTQLLLNCTNAGIIDNAGKNDIETVGNAQISTSVKKYGTGSMYFDAVNTTGLYSAAKDTFAYGTGDFTIEFWMYANATAAAIVFDQRASGAASEAPTIYLYSGNVIYYVIGDRITSSSTVSTGVWYHIAVCRSGTSTKLFINGTQSGSTYTDTFNYIVSPVYIGKRWDSSSSFNGYIDDLRITKGQALYTSNFTPPTSALPNV